MTVGGAERTFLLHVPASYDPVRTVPAVVALHYRPGSATAMRELTGFDATAAQPATPAEPALDPGVHRTTTHCQDGSDVDVYVVDGGEHAWFGATAGELKDATVKVKATDVLWAFFAAHPRRR